jgi:ubiquinone/menaquinone biosynthesis C-methylase UbiE
MMTVHHSTKTSTGHELSESSYLDSHFEAMKPEYEAMIRSVGIKSGWNVLDAGCGGGSFLPLLAELVGSSGHISAYDLAPENVGMVDSLVENGQFPCSIETRVGNLTSLPYEDNRFDAVWCANITQYLTDDELSQMLAEFCRVVRPEGLVAVKEYDLALSLFSPFDPTMIWRLYDKTRHHIIQIRGTLRTFQLPTWLKQAGLTNVGFTSFLSERKAPLRPIEREFISTILQLHTQEAESVDLPEQDMVVWRELANFDSPSHILKHPDFYFREGHIVVVGQAPEN